MADTAHALSEPEPARPAQYYIGAQSSVLERRPRILKHGDTFGVFDHYGDIVSGGGSPEGIFHNDTRYLSALRLLVNGRRPLLLSSTVQDNNAILTVDLTNPDFVTNGAIVLARDTIHIVRSKFLWRGTCYERFAIRNFGDAPQSIQLSVHFAMDFVDIFEVRGNRRAQNGDTTHAATANGVRVTYTGLDGVARHTAVRFDPAPDQVDHEAAVYDVVLPPDGAQTCIFCTVTSAEAKAVAAPPPTAFYHHYLASRRAMRAATAGVATIDTSNEIFNEVICRSMSDLRMLQTETPHGPFPYAGIPWFSTAFGRDSIITAIETLWIDPSMAKGVLMFLAATQASETRPEADAEPGKILHETRRGEMARTGEVPFALYYGSVDATPLFVVLAGLYFERTRDHATLAALWPHIESALSWIETYGDRDGDGFVEYQRAGENGLDNQGWKDSRDSVFHADGTIATGPIALCEVQGYVFAAMKHATAIAAALGKPDRALDLDRGADRLRRKFEKAFWCEDIGTYAIALDGAKQPCKVRTSNAGHLLFSGIAGNERGRRVADQLMDRAFFTGWGIRTVAAGEARYNPMSYHNGSVWPHDNALIGLGFARYGMKRHLQRLFAGMFNAATYMDLRRLPELFCGFRRMPGRGPTYYPVACSPQAWASGVPFALLHACLGLEFEFAADNVRFCDPRFPRFLDEVSVHGLGVGAGHLDVVFRRLQATQAAAASRPAAAPPPTGDEVSVTVVGRSGDAGATVTF